MNGNPRHMKQRIRCLLSDFYVTSVAAQQFGGVGRWMTVYDVIDILEDCGGWNSYDLTVNTVRRLVTEQPFPVAQGRLKRVML